MAIQLRRGNSADLIKSNLLAGEMAISVDTGVPTVGLGNGESVDIVTNETFAEQINQFGGMPFSEQEETVKGYFDENGNEVQTQDGYTFSDFAQIDSATNYYISISQTYYDDDDNEVDFFPQGYKAAAYDDNDTAIGLVSVIEVVKNRLYILNSGYVAKKIKICCLSPEAAVYNAFENADYVFEEALLNIFNHVVNGYDGIITTDKLADRAVTESKLEIGAVSESVLKDGCVTKSKLCDDLKNKLGGAGSSTYCTCATAAGTTTKVAVVTAGTFSLTVGAAVDVKFENYNSANAPTLNVDGTGAKSIRLYNSAAAGAYSWSNGAVVRFIYDGENWVMQNGMRGTLTYYGAVKLSNSVTSTSTVLAATSSAVKQAYDLAENAIPSSKRAAANGVASLDENGKIPTEQIPAATIYDATFDSSSYSKYTVSDNSFPPADGTVFGIKFNLTTGTSGLDSSNVKIRASSSSSTEYSLKAPCLISQSTSPAIGYAPVLGYGIKYLAAGQVVLCVRRGSDIVVCDRTLFSDGYTSALPVSMGGTGVSTINSLKSSLGISDSGWKTATASSAVTENTFLQYRKIGSQVFVRANIRTTISSGTSSTLFTLPSGYRPTKPLAIAIPNYNHKASLMIGTDGTVHVEYVTYATSQTAISTVSMPNFSVLISTSFLCD